MRYLFQSRSFFEALVGPVPTSDSKASNVGIDPRMSVARPRLLAGDILGLDAVEVLVEFIPHFDGVIKDLGQEVSSE